MATVGEEYFEPVADGDAGRDDKEIVAVAGVVAVFAAVQVVVEDQAGHDHSFPCAGSHLESLARQLVGCLFARGLLTLTQLVQQVGAGVGFFGDFVEPDRGFDGFLLGKKQFLMRFPLWIGEPVGQQITGNTAGHTSITGLPPLADCIARLVDQMLAEICPQVIEVEHAALRLLADGNLRHIGRKDPPAIANVLVVQISLQVGCVVALRFAVRRVEDWVIGGQHCIPFE